MLEPAQAPTLALEPALALMLAPVSALALVLALALAQRERGKRRCPRSRALRTSAWPIASCVVCIGEYLTHFP